MEQNTAILISEDLKKLFIKENMSELSRDIFKNHIPIGTCSVVLNIDGYTTKGFFDINRKSKDRDNKAQMKIGKLVMEINSIRQMNLKPSEVEMISNEIMGKFLSEFNKYEIVSGEQIRHWYLYKNYAYSGENTKSGSLSQSCMRKEDTQSFLDIYVDNPDVIKMLIKKDANGKLLTRALLWKLDSGQYYMDRVYYTLESEVNEFKNYAIAHNYYYHHYLGSQRYEIYKNNVKVDVEFRTKLKTNVSSGKYPYIDSIFYYYPFENIWSNKSNNNSPFILSMKTTRGTFDRIKEDNTYAITNEDFENAKIYLKTYGIFDISKLSFANIFEYGSLKGDKMKFFKEKKWTNDDRIFELLSINDFIYSSSNLVLRDCNSSYILKVLKFLSTKKATIKFITDGKVISDNIEDLYEFIFDKNIDYSFKELPISILINTPPYLNLNLKDELVTYKKYFDLLDPNDPYYIQLLAGGVFKAKTVLNIIRDLPNKDVFKKNIVNYLVEKTKSLESILDIDMNKSKSITIAILNLIHYTYYGPDDDSDIKTELNRLTTDYKTYMDEIYKKVSEL